MAILAKLIGICFPQNRYSYLKKKDDNHGITETKDWVEWLKRNPIPDNIQELEDKVIRTIAKRIIDALKYVPITSSNYETIKDRLYQIAKHDPVLRDNLVKYIRKLKMENSLNENLRASVILAVYS